MFNVTNWLLAQMLMARPQSPTADGHLPGGAGRPDAQQANINIQEIPTAPVPAPSWDDARTRYLMHHLLFNSRPLSTQGGTYRDLNRDGPTDPAPNPELFDPTLLSDQYFWQRNR